MRKKSISPVKGNETIHSDLEKSDESSSIPSKVREVSLPWTKIFIGVALTATIAGALYATKTVSVVEKNIAAVKESSRPANVKLTKITTADCAECFNLDDTVNTFKKQNVSVEEENAVAFDSPDGLALVKQLGIKRVPTYVVTGEVDKSNLESFTKTNGEMKDKTFIFTKVLPIFIDTETKKEIGRVTATLLSDSTCAQCIDPKLTIEAYKKAGVKITQVQEIAWNSSAGRQIISQYKITKVPTFLLSSGVEFYDSVKANWTGIGTVEQDKTYVARNLFLPYRDLEKGQILGLVAIIHLTDSTCADCYKPEVIQKSVLAQRFGVAIRSERSVDVNSGEGKGLISQYKITKVPTILLSSEADDYPDIKNIWKSVGTIESNGWHVFREMQQLGGVVYKDLTDNQIIRPAQAAPPPGGANQ